eukprot:m.300532 g.300532  ORF g.300532 m.300532 type:complete len:542 (-) comp16421_c1_seq44:1214-2839(-)
MSRTVINITTSSPPNSTPILFHNIKDGFFETKNFNFKVTGDFCDYVDMEAWESTKSVIDRDIYHWEFPFDIYVQSKYAQRDYVGTITQKNLTDCVINIKKVTGPPRDCNMHIRVISEIPGAPNFRDPDVTYLGCHTPHDDVPLVETNNIDTSTHEPKLKKRKGNPSDSGFLSGQSESREKLITEHGNDIGKIQDIEEFEKKEKDEKEVWEMVVEQFGAKTRKVSQDKIYPIPAAVASLRQEFRLFCRVKEIFPISKWPNITHFAYPVMNGSLICIIRVSSTDIIQALQEEFKCLEAEFPEARLVVHETPKNTILKRQIQYYRNDDGQSLLSTVGIKGERHSLSVLHEEDSAFAGDQFRFGDQDDAKLIFSKVDDENNVDFCLLQGTPSVGHYKKCKFISEGFLKEEGFSWNKVVSMSCYGITTKKEGCVKLACKCKDGNEINYNAGPDLQLTINEETKTGFRQVWATGLALQKGDCGAALLLHTKDDAFFLGLLTSGDDNNDFFLPAWSIKKILYDHNQDDIIFSDVYALVGHSKPFCSFM